MQQIKSYSELLKLLESNTLTPFNIYNIDHNPVQYLATEYYLENDNDTIDIDQPLNIAFIDIEVYLQNEEFPSIKKAREPIVAITIYANGVYHSYFLLRSGISIDEEFVRNHLNIDENESVQLHPYDSELDMIIAAWNLMRSEDPAIISGWNVDRFDIPYIYHRLVTLTDKRRAEQILSRFETVTVNTYGEESFIIVIPEFCICDLMYLYKPRDEGGLNYGEKQQSYSLDNVSDIELKEGKIEYGEEGESLSKLYDTDIHKFLIYNINDVVLVKKLNDKLRHIELHNTIRRLMKTPFSRSLYGSSVMFDSYVAYKLIKDEGKYVRFGLNEEWNLSISKDELSLIHLPKGINKLSIDHVTESEFRNIVGKYPGAYVKQPNPLVISDDDHLILDMDATSLYPSTIIQNNISFDSFFGQIIDPNAYKFINLVEQTLSSGKKFPVSLNTQLYELISRYAKDENFSNKTKFIHYCYAILAFILIKLETAKGLDVFRPGNINDYVLLKKFLIPAIDIIEQIHPDSKEYNTFCYEYLINSRIPQSITNLYIIENILQPTARISKIPANEFESYIVKNNLIVTLSGGLFNKHEVKKGLFIDFLKNINDLRKRYESERDKYNEKSEEYKFYDLRQKTIKIVANTTYGLFGLSTYRFSNFRLAKAITIQSRLMLKIAQTVADMYICEYLKYHNNKQ